MKQTKSSLHSRRASDRCLCPAPLHVTFYTFAVSDSTRIREPDFETSCNPVSYVFLVMSMSLWASFVAVNSFDSVSPRWDSCPVYTPGVPLFAGCEAVSNKTVATCATVQVPLDIKSSDTIGFFVKRVLAPSQPSQGEIWLLNGGPGSGGAEMECLLAGLFAQTSGVFDLVIPDHRGVGRSTQLNGGNCTDGSVDCAKRAIALYGATYLRSFTTTNAARDIEFVVQQDRAARHDPTFARMVYGVSYGTYLAQRFLQLFPHTMTATVLDGVVAPDLSRFAYFDLTSNDAGLAVLTHCAADAVCAEQLGMPHYALTELYGLLRSGELAQTECMAAAGFPMTVGFMQLYLGTMTLFWENRVLLGPFIKRWLRCSASDAAELKHFFTSGFATELTARLVTPVSPGVRRIDRRSSLRALQPSQPLPPPVVASPRPLLPHHHYPPPPPPTPGDLKGNTLLANNIITAELLVYNATTLTAAEQETSEELLSFAENQGILAQFRDFLAGSGWPVYTPEADLYRRYPNTSAPVLLLNGDTDAQTSLTWMRRASSFYQQPDQQSVVIPYAVHGSAFPGRSPVVTPGGRDCGLQLAASFFAARGRAADKACLADLVPIDFAGRTDAARSISLKSFGTANLWGSA
jgi:pimeloyl-ACP methyl ester carboxylesterase